MDISKNQQFRKRVIYLEPALHQDNQSSNGRGGLIILTRMYVRDIIYVRDIVNTPSISCTRLFYSFNENALCCIKTVKNSQDMIF